MATLKHAAHIAIKRVRLLDIEHTLAIRRVAYKSSALGLRNEFFQFTAAHADEVVNAGSFGVCGGKSRSFTADIGAVSKEVMSLALKVARTLALGIPHIARDIAPALGGKVAVDSGGDIARHHRALDKYRTRSAHGVIERMIRAQTREPAQRRSKSLFYRGVVCILAVSSLMKSRAGGVEHERNFVFHYRELNLIDRSALFKPLDRIFLF